MPHCHSAMPLLRSHPLSTHPLPHCGLFSLDRRCRLCKRSLTASTGRGTTHLRILDHGDMPIAEVCEVRESPVSTAAHGRYVSSPAQLRSRSSWPGGVSMDMTEKFRRCGTGARSSTLCLPARSVPTYARLLIKAMQIPPTCVDLSWRALARLARFTMLVSVLAHCLYIDMRAHCLIDLWCHAHHCASRPSRYRQYAARFSASTFLTCLSMGSSSNSLDAFPTRLSIR